MDTWLSISKGLADQKSWEMIPLDFFVSQLT